MQLNIKSVLFLINQFRISKEFKCQKPFYFKLFSLINKVKWFQVSLPITYSSIQHQSFIYTHLNVKTVLFQSIQFSLSMHFSSVWHIDRTLLGATNTGQSWPRSNYNEEILNIPPSSSITAVSPSDCLVLYLGHTFGESFPSAESRCIQLPQPTGPTSVSLINLPVTIFDKYFPYFS